MGSVLSRGLGGFALSSRWMSFSTSVKSLFSSMSEPPFLFFCDECLRSDHFFDHSLEVFDRVGDVLTVIFFESGKFLFIAEVGGCENVDFYSSHLFNISDGVADIEDFFIFYIV